jgi:hypothetical protein
MAVLAPLSERTNGKNDGALLTGCLELSQRQLLAGADVAVG